MREKYRPGRGPAAQPTARRRSAPPRPSPAPCTAARTPHGPPDRLRAPFETTPGRIAPLGRRLPSTPLSEPGGTRPGTPWTQPGPACTPSAGGIDLHRVPFFCMLHGNAWENGRDVARSVKLAPPGRETSVPGRAGAAQPALCRCCPPIPRVYTVHNTARAPEAQQTQLSLIIAVSG